MARWGGDRTRGRDARRKPILLLGHLDTVWPMGTLAKMPFRVAKGKAFGPGVYDMKAGVVMALHALAMLRERRGADDAGGGAAGAPMKKLAARFRAR